MKAILCAILLMASFSVASEECVDDDEMATELLGQGCTQLFITFANYAPFSCSLQPHTIAPDIFTGDLEATKIQDLCPATCNFCEGEVITSSTTKQPTVLPAPTPDGCMDNNERLIQDGHLSTDCATYVEFAFSYNQTCEVVDVDGIPLSVICPVSCLICEESSASPTIATTISPSLSPSKSPTTNLPTVSPTDAPVIQPTSNPSGSPTITSYPNECRELLDEEEVISCLKYKIIKVQESINGVKNLKIEIDAETEQICTDAHSEADVILESCQTIARN